MKKLIVSLAILGSLVFSYKTAKADTSNATIYVNLGAVKFYLPVASGANATYLWDFNNKKSLVGTETPVVSYKQFTLTGGAVTTLDGQGAPFARVYYTIPNPLDAFTTAFNDYHLGAFGGRDFTVGGKSAWIYGIAASKTLW